MIAYIVKRLVLMVGTLVGIIVLTFVITRLAPGDPATLQAQSASGANTGDTAALDELIMPTTMMRVTSSS